jgi:uncharacterized protein
MSMTERWFPGRLHELSGAECWELLRSTSVGRVAYTDRVGPVVLPVNYAVDGRSVLIRTSAHGELARHSRSSVVAIEVDDTDDFSQAGWSVLLRGHAEEVGASGPRDPDAQPDPWPAGERSLLLRVTPSEVTGRRLMPG